MSSTATTADIVNAMLHSIQDEYHAEAVYQRILADLGEVWPFVNISIDFRRLLLRKT
jgi:hypothetical protein